ncbi:MAG: class I SAM-dependent methyltransferase, partial [Candidatus Hydrogenedentes bacterium]|nr:class I SAM-dependent methyltransferase [Candidatus Hydrogenedentota bacterium]
MLRGHSWCYRNEFASIPECEDGDVVDVYSSNRRFVGRGFFQAAGGIAVRIMACHQAVVDGAFLGERIAEAHAFRQRLFPGQNVYRWIFGESDGLPGLVADRYGAVVAVQTSCAFYGRHLDVLATAFASHEGVEGVRLEAGHEIVRAGVVPEAIEVAVDGIRVLVSLDSGQKTGLFLDQRANWPEVRRFAQGSRVLDGHCYQGMWSIHAAMAGARDILGVDTSAPAIDAANAAAQLNNVADRCRFECADVAEVLARGERYGVIVLDPPAFAKSRGR